MSVSDSVSKLRLGKIESRTWSRNWDSEDGLADSWLPLLQRWHSCQNFALFLIRAQFSLSLFFLFSCYGSYCHWCGWSWQYLAFVQLINLDLNDDDIFNQSEAKKLSPTENRHTGRLCSTSRHLQKVPTFVLCISLLTKITISLF